ncbi:nuclear receptor corepressor 2-like isoform X2 [Oscarella lobularis]|uniref:nuclear receptor corepressor 2-like isoform X2 n=1 Tax=Oscarella lobularis TaxID=121494 RepID=UPI00331335A2
MSFAGTKRPRSPDSDEELSEGEVQDLSSSSSSSSEAISQPPRKIKASQTHKMSPGSFSKNLDYQAIEKKKAKKLAKLRKKRRKRRKAAKRRLQLREENGDKRKRKATDSFPLSSSKEPQSSTSYSTSVPPRSAPSNIPTSVIVHTKLSYEPELVSPFGSPTPPPPLIPPPPPPPPPPEDVSQPSQPASVLPGKEDLVQSMELVDREITEVEQQISQLEKRLMQEEMELLAEEKANADMPPGSSSHGGDKEGKDSSHKDDDSTNKKEGENLSVVDELTSYYSETMQSLIRKIYAENRKRAAAAHALCSVKDSAPVYSSAPLYNQPSDLPFYKENQEKAKAFHPKLVAYLRRKRDQKLAWKQRTAREYNRLHREWTKRVERWENDPRRKAKESKIRDFYERMFPEIKRQREQQERFQRAQRPLDGFARSDADLKEIIDGLRDQELLEKQVYSLSVEPPDLLDSDERKVQFISRNGFVEDPMADHKQRRMNALWTDDEKRIFREQFVKHPKDFERIALHLPKKSCGDCVQYYYLSKKKEGYKQMLRKYSQAKRRTKVVQSRPQLAAGMEEKTKEIAERREHGVFGIEQDSGRITYTVPNWKEEEIEAMKEGLREWGKDWPTISNRIGTKTEHQCRSFFTHYKRKLHLVSYLNEYKAREKAVGMRYATAEEDEKEKKTDDAATLSRPSSLQDILLLSRENISLPSDETSNLADSAARTALTPTPEQEQFKKFINLAASVVHDYESSRQSTGDALAEEQPKEESLQLTPPPPPPPPSSVRVHFSGILTEPSSSSSSSSVLTAVVSTAPELVTATVTAASSPSIVNKPILVASPPPPPPSIFKPSVEQVLQLSFASSASHSAAPVLPPLIPLAVSANSAPVEPPETPTVVKLALQGVPFEADPTVSADNESSHRRESEIDVKEDGVEELKLSKDDNVIQKDDDEVTSEKITESDGDDGGRKSDESVADSEESHEEGEIIGDEEEMERDEDAEKSVHDDEKGSESDVVVVLSTSSETRKPFVDEPAEQATAGSDGDKEELWSSQEDCGSLYQEEETAHCGGMTPEEEKKDDERATRMEAAREERAKERSEVLTSSQENSETSSIRHAEDESAFQYEAISPPDSMTSSIGDGGDDRSTLPVSSPFLSTTPTESGTLSPSYSSPYLAATKEKRYVPLLEAISSEEED